VVPNLRLDAPPLARGSGCGRLVIPSPAPTPITMRTLGLVLAASLALVGCDEKKDAVPAAAGEGRRSDAVTTSKPTVQAAAPAQAAPAHAEAPKGPRAFCNEATAAKGAKLPATKLAQLVAGSKPMAAARPTPPAKHWTWVNLWAAWCGPCREEIPRLKRWEKELAGSATPIAIAFLSLDDDERQAQKFLDAQPPGGLQRSFWIGENERERAAWLGAFGLKESPNLPVQLLFTPAGELACIVGGAVDDGDFDAVKKFLAASTK
jgi:thiol-disulfide isomerase/thioredoxin